jgi:O-antigen/teichoic acid export membrane protein
MSEARAPAGAALTGRVARGGIAAFAVQVVGAGLTYCAQLLIARSIGAGGYGIYAYVFAWMTVLAYCAALGFDVSMLRFVSAYRAQGAWALLRGVIRYAERRTAAFGCIIVLVGALVIRSLAGALPPGLANTFLVGLLLVPVWALLWIRSSIVRAFGGVVSALAPDRVIRDGVLLGIVAIAHLALGWGMGAPSVMGATLVSSVVGLGLVSLAMRQRTPRAISGIAPEYAGRIWARAALPLVTIGVAEVAMNRTGVVLLGWTGQTTAAGIYALAFNIAFLTALPRTAVNALLAPAISDLFVRGDRVALQALATKAALWTLLGAACIALPVALLAEPVLGWFGRDFAAGVPALRILLIGQVVVAGAGSQLYLLTMTGHERSAAVLMLAAAAGNAAAAAGFISLLGLTGAAIATTLTLVAWNVAMALLVWRYLGLVPGVLAAARMSPGTRLQDAT